MLEKVEGRDAGIEDLSVYQDVLSKLHDMGVSRGDVNRYNFVVADDGSWAKLVGFESARKCTDERILQKEMESLSDELRDESGRGGKVIITTSEDIMET